MNITKQKETHRHREQTSAYEWGEWWKEWQHRGKGLKGTNSKV